MKKEESPDGLSLLEWVERVLRLFLFCINGRFFLQNHGDKRATEQTDHQAHPVACAEADTHKVEEDAVYPVVVMPRPPGQPVTL
jgi:hypothetical protein